MRSIRLIWVGKTQEPYLRSGINAYMKKLSHYIKIDSDEIKPAQYSSGTVNNWRGISRVNFFIGGAYGIDKSILPSGIQFLSLSEMTFTHQMVRLFLLEQIYRAFTIIRGEPYHNY